MRIKGLGFRIWGLVFLLSANAFAASPFSGSASKQPIEINADSLEVMQAQKKAIFSGNVEAVQGSMRIKSDKMTVYYADKGSSDNAIKKIEVSGNVFLQMPKETARGSFGTYDTTRNFVTLEGDVILTRDNNILKGNRLDFDINSGHSKLSGGVTTTTDGQQQGGRVRGLFVPEGE